MSDRVRQHILNHLPLTVRPACKDNGTLIGLPYPYTTPCVNGMFQELYYWDTYFTNIGLLLIGMTEQAKHNIDNMLYLINRFEKMPNGNRTYYLNRSQPPFLSQMVRELFNTTDDIRWLREYAYPALKTEYAFWMKKRSDPSGLNRYGCDLTREEEYLDVAAYFADRIARPLPDSRDERVAWGKSMMALAESGWDCTGRFAMDAHEHIPVDLNSLLYLLETNMAYFATVLQKPSDASEWQRYADQRQNRMNAVLWNNNRRVFTDVHSQTNRSNELVSAAAFYPLFAGLATPEQAASTVQTLPLLEYEHGLACCEQRDDSMHLQWDFPNGWACLHYLVIQGLLRYGYEDDARRIAETYTRTVEREFERTGNLWEKYNVVTGTVSASFEYDTPPMMGWSAGVYLFCEAMLK